MPGGNEYTSLLQERGAEPPGDTYTQAYKSKVYRPQAFLANVSPPPPDPNRPLVWCPWESNDLKELRKAVADYGPNAPWAITLLQEVAYHPFCPQELV